jgi:hypothetical protein
MTDPEDFMSPLLQKQRPRLLATLYMVIPADTVIVSATLQFTLWSFLPTVLYFSAALQFTSVNTSLTYHTNPFRCMA